MNVLFKPHQPHDVLCITFLQCVDNPATVCGYYGCLMYLLLHAVTFVWDNVLFSFESQKCWNQVFTLKILFNLTYLRRFLFSLMTLDISAHCVPSLIITYNASVQYFHSFCLLLLTMLIDIILRCVCWMFFFSFCFVLGVYMPLLNVGENYIEEYNVLSRFNVFFYFFVNASRCYCLFFLIIWPLLPFVLT